MKSLKMSTYKFSSVEENKNFKQFFFDNLSVNQILQYFLWYTRTNINDLRVTLKMSQVGY